MPSINGGRVTTDGKGQVGFKDDNATTGTSGASAGASLTAETSGLTSLVGDLLSSDVKTVKGRNLGSGKGIFAGSNGSQNVVLDFKTIVAGNGVTLTEDQNSITIAYAYDARRISFLTLTEAPERITSFGLLYGTLDGKLAFAPTPTVQNSVLTFNGMNLVWSTPTNQGTVRSVTAVGDQGITVLGGPITDSGTLKILLANTGVTAGTYNSVTVDAQGRVTAGTNVTQGQAITAANLGSGATVFASKSGSTLNFKTIKGFGAVSINESADEITIGALAGVSSVALSSSDASVRIAGGPITTSGTIDLTLSPTGVQPGTYNSVTVDAKGRVISGTATLATETTASNLGTGEAVFATKVGNDFRFKTILGAGATSIVPSANAITIRTSAVTSVAFQAGVGVSLSGDTLISSQGTVRVGLANTTVVPGSYSTANLTVDQQGRITAISNGTAATSVATAQNLGTGTNLLEYTSGQNFYFNTLRAGTNVSLSSANGEITISAIIPAAAGPTPTLNIKTGAATYSGIENLTIGTGLSVTSPTTGNATLTAGFTVNDGKGQTLNNISYLDLVGITLTQANGHAVLTVAPQLPNASVTSGSTTVTNPTSLSFVGATVSGAPNGVATVTVPPAAIIVSAPPSTGGSTSTVYPDVRSLRFGSGLNIATTSNQGEVLVTATPQSGSSFNGFPVSYGDNSSVSANSFLIGSGLEARVGEANAVTLSANVSNIAVLLSGDQIVAGKKTFSDRLTANTDMVVGQNLTIGGQVISNGLIQAKSGIDVIGGAKLTSSLTVSTNNSAPIAALVANGTTASGTWGFDQVSGRWSSFLANGALGTIAGSFEGTLTGSVKGNATSADRLSTARNIFLSGDVVGFSPFDGTANATVVATLANTSVVPGTYPAANVTVDQKGRITSIYSQPVTFNGQNVGTGSQALIVDGANFFVRTFRGANAVTVAQVGNDIVVGLDSSGLGTVRQVAINGDNGIISTGGPVSTTGTFNISLANTTVTAGTYANPTLTIDSTGRITQAAAGAAMVSSDTASNLGSGDAHVFAQKSNGDFQFRSLVAGTNITLTETGQTITINSTASSDGISTVLVSDGVNSVPAKTLTFSGATVSGSANSATITVPGGTVTSVNAQGIQGVTVSGGPITTQGSLQIGLANTGVTAGTYNYATLTVDAQGRVTAVSSNAAPEGSGGGTVTSVAVASPSNDLVVTGSPITTSGTVNLELGNSGVTAGTYTFASITVDAKGRVTSATSNSAGDAPVLLDSDVVTVTNSATSSYTFQRSGSTLALHPTFLQVYVNRQRMRRTEYSYSGNTVTFLIALNTGDELEVVTIA
jgi:hypothetical protein